ncbi:MAG: cupin domain-containing protein [Alcanivoracaceae bacterium]|nr:cupin domain-containing protein [Alcanivoracaceae bacterium]
MRPQFTLPISGEQFLAEYWQKKPLVMRNVASGLSHPDADTLAGLALEDEVESRLITGHGNGPWNLQNGPFQDNDFNVLPRENWTLLVQSVDCFLTEVSLLLDRFDFLPSWRLEDIMISYAAKGGSVGPHFDRYDVFLIQASGKRRWKIGGPCDERTALLQHDQLKLLEKMDVREEYVLEAGDALYLPPGIAHWGTAEDSDCITWSVGFRAPSPIEVLGRLADQAAEMGGETLFRDTEREVPARREVLESADIARLTQQAIEALSPSIKRQALAALLSESRCPNGLDFEVDCQQVCAADETAMLVRHGAARLILDAENNAWINGDNWALSEDALPLARLLAKQRLYSDEELQALMTDDGQDLIDEWIDAGYFTWLE